MGMGKENRLLVPLSLRLIVNTCFLALTFATNPSTGSGQVIRIVFATNYTNFTNHRFLEPQISQISRIKSV